MQFIFLSNLCFNSNIKFKFKLYSNYIKIVYIIIIIVNIFTIYLLISMYLSTGIIYPKYIPRYIYIYQ